MLRCSSYTVYGLTLWECSEHLQFVIRTFDSAPKTIWNLGSFVIRDLKLLLLAGCFLQSPWLLDNLLTNIFIFTFSTYRYIGYRQWTGWVYGRLGRFCRRPIPSCIVKSIRSSFPSEDGTYKLLYCVYLLIVQIACCISIYFITSKKERTVYYVVTGIQKLMIIPPHSTIKHVHVQVCCNIYLIPKFTYIYWNDFCVLPLLQLVPLC